MGQVSVMCSGDRSENPSHSDFEKNNIKSMKV